MERGKELAGPGCRQKPADVVSMQEAVNKFTKVGWRNFKPVLAVPAYSA